jgi:hypothetical protein
MVGDRRTREARTFFGVFVRACNDRESTRRPSHRVALIDAFGKRVRPVGLPAENPFAYAPVPLEPYECLPAPGSVADRAADGALVLFDVPVDFLGERPIAFEIAGASGQRERVLLDL